MNERIQELAEQAEQYAYRVAVGGDECQEAYTKKFAELIVEECMNATRGASTGLDAFNNIKEHFGVE